MTFISRGERLAFRLRRLRTYTHEESQTIGTFVQCRLVFNSCLDEVSM